MHIGLLNVIQKVKELEDVTFHYVDLKTLLSRRTKRYKNSI